MNDFRGRSPDRILTNSIIDHSSWHFFQARSWLDYAMRGNAPSAIHYCAFELRYGLEYLLFELLVLTGESLTLREYRSAIGKPKEMKKLLSGSARNYGKLAEFSAIVVSVDSHAPALQFWDLEKIFRYWGIASEFLHFVGPHEVSYAGTEWLTPAIARLDAVLDEIWKMITGTLGKAIMRPSQMEPEVRQGWLEFSDGKLSKADLKTRLRLMQPGLKARRGESGWRHRGRRVYKIPTD